MKQQKNVITLALMISSIVLLIMLEVFWLQNSYEKAFFDLRRETSLLFRSTVMAMRDSLFVKNIKPVPDDSVLGILNSKFFASHDSIQVFKMKERSKEKTSIQIVVASEPGDTIDKDFLKPLAANINRIKIDNRNGMQRGFMIQLTQDSLNLDSLSDKYKIALAAAGIDASFRLERLPLHKLVRQHRNPLDAFGDNEFMREPESASDKFDLLSDTVVSEPVRLNPLTRYVATVAGVRRLVLKEITPQIFFSVFLTLTTAASFLFMYRNIRSQQRLMQAKNDFISNVTHELKTPVATVSVALEALQNFNAIDNPALTKEYLDIALRELNRLALMTDTILKTSVFEDKGVSFNPEVIHMDKVVEEVLDSMRLLLEKKETTLRYKKEGADFKISGGAVHLTNMIYNLIDNALKYSLERPVVNITVARSPSHVTLSVKDEGMGIRAEYHKKIFEKFFRVPAGDVHNTKGYGLGLNYVAAVVKSHRGSINVNSTPEKGSEFVVSLPIVK